MKIEQKLDSRKAALLLRRLADALEKNSDRTLPIGDEVVQFPLEPEIELEFEQDEDKAELEFEIKWQPLSRDNKKKRVPKFVIFKGDNDQWYFHLKASNNEIILASEAYKRKEGAEKGIKSIKTNASPANIEYRKSRAGQLYFVLKAANHEIIGVSQMYKRQSGAEKGAASVIENAPAAEVSYLDKDK